MKEYTGTCFLAEFMYMCTYTRKAQNVIWLITLLYKYYFEEN